MQLAGQNSEDFFQGILIGTLFQKSENLVQILRNFFENFIDRTKLRAQFFARCGPTNFKLAPTFCFCINSNTVNIQILNKFGI